MTQKLEFKGNYWGEVNNVIHEKILKKKIHVQKERSLSLVLQASKKNIKEKKIEKERDHRREFVQ